MFKHHDPIHLHGIGVRDGVLAAVVIALGVDALGSVMGGAGACRQAGWAARAKVLKESPVTTALEKTFFDIEGCSAHRDVVGCYQL